MTTSTFQPDDTTAIDAFINLTNATTNYGTNATLQLGEPNSSSALSRILMKWDLSTIPAGSSQISATLSLWTIAASWDFASNSATLSIYHVLRDWVESQATWNVYATGLSWGTVGCSNTTTDIDPVAIGTGSWTSTLGAGVEIQFTFAEHALDPYYGGTLNIMIKTDLESNDMYVLESASSTTSANRPKLVTEYTEGGMFQTAIIYG